MKKTNEGKKYVQVQDNIWEITSTILSTKDHCVLAASCRALMFLVNCSFKFSPLPLALVFHFVLGYLHIPGQFILTSLWATLHFNVGILLILGPSPLFIFSPSVTLPIQKVSITTSLSITGESVFHAWGFPQVSLDS